jgi:hypothetical protein
VNRCANMTLDKLVTDEVSGSSAKSYVAEITRFHRIQASPMYHDAAEYVKGELKRLGLKDARIEQFPADGKHIHWTHRSPVGWDVRDAELSLVEPEERLLASYRDIPQSLQTFSKGTPKGGVLAELVDVGPGVDDGDYRGKKVKGKIVLATGRGRKVHEQAVFKRGAAGVITDTLSYEFPNVRETVDIPDAHGYQGLWPTADELKKLAFGFSLSKRQGNQLRKLLKSGKKVMLRATVDARLYPSHLEVVTATIKGSERPNEELFVVGHLCHPKPGANDNASGSGAVLEVARVITTMIKQGSIKGPKRTIRFIWVPETLGTVAYLANHEDVSSRFLAGINLDMVGEDQELCGSTLTMTKTPDSLPSFLNDYLPEVFERSCKALDKQFAIGLGTRFRFAPTTFSAGSDHAEFTASTTRVPCVSFTQWPDKYYHTSMDTIDKVSEDSMRRICWIATVATLELADAGPEKALLLIASTASKGSARIKDAGAIAVKSLLTAHDGTPAAELPDKLSAIATEGKSRLIHVLTRENLAASSAERFGKDLETDSLVNRSHDELTTNYLQEVAKIDDMLRLAAARAGAKVPDKPSEPKALKELAKMVPRKLFRGTLSPDHFRMKLGDEGYAHYRALEDTDRDFDNKMTELLNFADGRRTGAEVLDAVSAEYGKTDPDTVLRLFKDLKKAGLAELG